MSQESRRKLIKGLAVTLPAAWTTPMVESIVLPAHAETSPGCDAPEGCYVSPGPQTDSSFFWPGGAGPELVLLFDGDQCDSVAEPPSVLVMVAESLAAAQAEIECEGEFDEVVELTTEPSPGSGCAFFGCVTIL